MDRETLVKKRDDLSKAMAKLLADYNAVSGAFQFCEALIIELDASDTQEREPK